MELSGAHISCILDTGCEQSIAPLSVVKGMELRATGKRMYAANSTPILISGEVSSPLVLAGVGVDTLALISPNVEFIILDIDWMSKYNVQWNFGAGHISINNQLYQLNENPGPCGCLGILPLTDSFVTPKVTEVTDDFAEQHLARSMKADVERHMARSVRQSRTEERFIPKPSYFVELIQSKKKDSFSFQENEWVYYISKRSIRKKGFKEKGRYSGPYFLIRVLDPAHVIIQLSVRSQPFVASIDRLKRCDGDHPQSW